METTPGGGWGRRNPSTIGYSPELAPFPFDPDKARALLAEAGYKPPPTRTARISGHWLSIPGFPP